MLRMKIQVMDELWLSGLCLRLNTEEHRPLVIAQHCGAGIDSDALFDCIIFDGIHEYGRMEEPVARLIRDLEA